MSLFSQPFKVPEYVDVHCIIHHKCICGHKGIFFLLFFLRFWMLKTLCTSVNEWRSVVGHYLLVRGDRTQFVVQHLSFSFLFKRKQNSPRLFSAIKRCQGHPLTSLAMSHCKEQSLCLSVCSYAHYGHYFYWSSHPECFFKEKSAELFSLLQWTWSVWQIYQTNAFLLLLLFFF